ncbi:Hypothetical protein NCS54_00096000 [Fusarium falciforme]|uniref:Hypothetical protein n=1 Tax=Fusarium falciforme TaxID=195108 RepID=UPI0023015453|nr:Hypothetical protein NCS54_00096000 [Fusarium falciforme]WAO83761.1 Hypothetical protein NCS54_00096000 [Fusarium falciforme]
MMSPVLAYKEDGQPQENSTRPGAFFVGYSRYNLTPVMLRAAPAGTAPSIISDDLSIGCQLERVPGGRIESTEVILTAPAAVPGNISAMKTALEADGNFCDAFKGSSARSVYGQLEASWTSLSNGRHPHVVQRTALFRSGIDGPRYPLSVCQPKEPDGLLDPARQQSVSNPPKSRMLPDAQLFLLKGNRRQPGFLYKAPYMANLLYPSLLLYKLQQFSTAHPEDSISIKSMLFAVQLWCDIKAHPKLQREAFLTERQQIQDVSVDEFILGFEHWLRHHEEKQLLEYIHPFRFIHAFFSRDLQLSDEFYPAEDATLDAEEIKNLVAHVRAKSSVFSPEARIVVFPASMPGSNIPWPTGMLPFTPPSTTEMALINFDNVYSYGLPSYALTDRKLVEVAMPDIVAEGRFCGERFCLGEADIPLLRDLTSPGRVSLFGTKTIIGPIWKAPELPQTTIRPPVDEYETISGRWKPSGQRHPPFRKREVCSRLKVALNEMISSGDIEIRSGLRLDIDNSLTPFLRQSLEGEDSLNDTLVLVPQQSKVPRMSPMRLAELLIPLQHTGRVLSVAWREARSKLQDMDVGGLDEANRTVVRVLDIIHEAREQTKMEIEGLNELVASLENDPESVTKPFFSGTVAQRICRMIGINASTDWEEDAWSEGLREKLLDNQISIGETVERMVVRFDPARYPYESENLGIEARKKLEDLIATCDFAGQEDLLEAEYQLLVQQVNELSR